MKLEITKGGVLELGDRLDFGGDDGYVLGLAVNPGTGGSDQLGFVEGHQRIILEFILIGWNISVARSLLSSVTLCWFRGLLGLVDHIDDVRWADDLEGTD